MRKPNTWLAMVCSIFFSLPLWAQPTFPENGVADPRHGHYAFTNATIVKDAVTTLTNATLVIKDGKIVAVGSNLKVPAGAVEVDCKGKFLYPSFIDIYADYGTPAAQRTTGGTIKRCRFWNSAGSCKRWNCPWYWYSGYTGQ